MEAAQANLEAQDSAPAKPRVPRMPKDDAKDLEWYYAEERGRALSGGGSSNFAAAIDRLEKYSGHVVPCVHCGGIPEQRDPETDEIIQHEVGGTGFVVSGHQFREWRKLARDGRHKDEVQAWLERNAPRKRETVDPLTGKPSTTIHGDVSCPKCCKPSVESHKWTPGWVVRAGRRKGKKLTVRITAEVQATPSLDTIGGSDSTERLGRVGRHIDAVMATDARSALALELFYSPDGKSEAALWCLTEAGRGLLRENKRELPQQEYFRTLRMMQETNKSTGMSARFRQAERQAADCLRAAQLVWMDVVHPGWDAEDEEPEDEAAA